MQIAIGFVSMSGNTEDIVSIIQRELEQHDVNVTDHRTGSIRRGGSITF